MTQKSAALAKAPASDSTAQSAPEAAPSTAYAAFRRLQEAISHYIRGQDTLVERLLIALLADGHLLVEGPPGLAKTTAVKVLGDHLEGDFHRLQFTPDLLPGDLTGTDVYRPETGAFEFQSGPIFHNLILADEVNRAPAKVQSALLEAMGEGQVTVGSRTWVLPELFLVMATQNPIEQEGTYPLPEAQLDRFLMHVRVDYPEAAYEREILQLSRSQTGRRPAQRAAPRVVVTQDQVFAAREEVMALHMTPNLEEYLVQLLLATRNPAPYGGELGNWVEYGASPRGTIALDRCARARAWLRGAEYVTPDDIHAVAPDVLRHRILLSYQAEAAGVTPDRVIDDLLSRVPVA